MKPEVMWVIVGTYGVYCASNDYTRKGAIRRHEDDCGLSWTKLKARGDRVVKVTIRHKKNRKVKK